MGHPTNGPPSFIILEPMGFIDSDILKFNHKFTLIASGE